MLNKLRRLLYFAVALAALDLIGVEKPAITHREQYFESLTIGTQTYSNVTVTTQNKDYVFLLHSRGMVNVKVSELPIETRETLGYEVKKPVTTPSAAAWAKATLAKQTLVDLQKPEIKEIEKKFSAAPLKLEQLPRETAIKVLAAVTAVMLLTYLIFCYCSKLICKKAGHEPGAMIWIPILQMIPLLKAAKMSPVWLLAMFVPLLNMVAQILWCVKISQARGKSFWTAIFLILPVTGIFAFLYLALSDSAENKEQTKRISIMSLEAT